MFDWFKNIGRPKYPTWDDVPPPSDMEKIGNDMSKVVPFPEPKAVPYVKPPAEPEKPTTTYYRLGITNNSRVSFQMGYSEITMNADGVDNMIKQLQVFRDQIREYEENGDA